MNNKQDAALDAAAGLFLNKMLRRPQKRIARKERQLESKLQETSPEFADDMKWAMETLEKMLGG